MPAPTVISALRAFLPDYLDTNPVLSPPQRRALWAMQACRTPVLGGHVHVCADCGKTHFAYHSCNHKACPQCGRNATAQWVAREQAKLIGAPYFMVTLIQSPPPAPSPLRGSLSAVCLAAAAAARLTVPEELRGLFFGQDAKQAFDLLFAAASAALRNKLASPKWLGAQASGFTMVLHTWSQKMLFHPHLHAIVPGGGLDDLGSYVEVKNANFLLPVPVLSRAFRAAFKERMATQGWQCDPAVWRKKWGVHIQPFGCGDNAVKYLGTYVARSVIADSRIQSVTDTHVTIRHRDREQSNAPRRLNLTGVEFVRRYLRHVLPRGLRAVRYYGFCHPSAKKTRLKVTALSGKPIDLGAVPAPQPNGIRCPQCERPMSRVRSLLAPWRLPQLQAQDSARAPPPRLIVTP